MTRKLINMAREVNLQEGDVVEFRGELYFLFKRINMDTCMILPIDGMDLFDSPKPLSQVSKQLIQVSIYNLKKSDPGNLLYKDEYEGD